MLFARSYIDQLLDPAYERNRIAIKPPYTLGYEAAANGRDNCPYPLHLPSNDQWWQGWSDYHQDAGTLPHQQEAK